MREILQSWWQREARIIHVGFVTCFRSEGCGSYILWWLIITFPHFFLPPCRKDIDDGLHFNRGSQWECAIITQKYLCSWNFVFLLWGTWMFHPEKKKRKEMRVRRNEQCWVPVQTPPGYALLCILATWPLRIVSPLDSVASANRHCGPISERGRRLLRTFCQPLLDNCYILPSKTMASPVALLPWGQISLRSDNSSPPLPESMASIYYMLCDSPLISYFFLGINATKF